MSGLDQLPEALRSILEAADKTATKTIARGGSVYPTWYLVGPNDHITPIVSPFRGDGDKALAMASVRETIALTHATAYVYMAEAWVAFYPGAMKMRPADNPDRKEVITFIAVNAEHKWGLHREIIRGSAFSTLGPPEFLTAPTGPMTELLEAPSVAVQ